MEETQQGNKNREGDRMNKFWTVVITMNDVEAKDEEEVKQKVIAMGLPSWIDIIEIYDNKEVMDRIKRHEDVVGYR